METGARQTGGAGWLRAARAVVLAGLLALSGMAKAAEPEAGDDTDAGAVVFVYFRFGDDHHPEASIRLDQFEAHLQELVRGAYRVLPLPDIVAALRAGRPLPRRTVALTIDGTHRSVYEEAFPRLHRAGLPFTVFVAPDPLDRGGEAHVTWDELRRMAEAGTTIGVLAATDAPMPAMSPARNRAAISRAVARLRDELGMTPRLFAYPYGEYSLAVAEVVAGFGFEAAFGQHSGVAHRRSDFHALPRFPMTEAFGGIDRFRLAANTLPLPVTDVTPADTVLSINPPSFGFTVPAGLGDLDRLACFAAGLGRARIERLDGNRIEVRLTQPLPARNARINCTLPAGEGRWRWYGVQFFVP